MLPKMFVSSSVVLSPAQIVTSSLSSGTGRGLTKIVAVVVAVQPLASVTVTVTVCWARTRLTVVFMAVLPVLQE